MKWIIIYNYRLYIYLTYFSFLPQSKQSTALTISKKRIAISSFSGQRGMQRGAPARYLRIGAERLRRQRHAQPSAGGGEPGIGEGEQRRE
jgi:hypothetical protein